MKLLRFLAVSLWATALWGKPQSEWLKDAQKRFVTEVLPNGLTVVCYPIPDQHNVRVGITYDVGSKDELPGEYGLAHMIEHMIFKGTDKMSETDLKAIAEKFCAGSIGIGFNAFTSRDLTRYFFNTDKDNYRVFLDILADCMFNVRFDENHFASEVKAVLEEINLRSPNLPAYVYDEASGMYPDGHPYHHPIIGYKETLLGLTSDDLKAFYKRNYHPSRALLTIVGDIDVKQALAYARKTFNTNVALPQRKEFTVQPVLTKEFSRKKVISYKPIPNPMYYSIWKFPEGEELGVKAQLLGKVLSDRFHKSLVVEKDLVLSASASVIPERFGSFFIIGFSPKEGNSDKEIRAAIFGELEKISQEGPTANEVASFKHAMEAAFLRFFETTGGVGTIAEMGFFPTRSIDTGFSDFEKAMNITPDDIKAFAQEHLRSFLRSSIVCLPIPPAEQERWNVARQEEDAYEQTLLAQKIRQSDVEPPRYAHTLPEPKLVTFKAQRPDKVITLSNGLKVCLKKREASPFIYGAINFQDQELFDISSNLIASALVHAFAMNFINDGTEKESRDQLRQFFEMRGAAVGFAQHGCTFNCPADGLSSVLGKIYQMMKQPKYDETLLQQEIQSARQRIQMSKMYPGYVAGRTLDYELQKAYSWTLTDDEVAEELSSVTRDTLIRFNKQYLNPDGMFLVLVGNIDLTTIERDLEKVLGSWQVDRDTSLNLMKKEDIPVLTNPVPTTTIKTIPVDQVVLALGRVTNYAHTSDMYALSLIQSYVDKRMFEIRERTGLFYAGQTALVSGSTLLKGIAYLVFPLSVFNVEQAETAIKETLADIAKQGIPQEHIAKAKEQVQMDLVKMFTTNGSLCNSFVQLMSGNEPWDIYEQRLATIQALTKKEIDEVAKKYLDPTQWTTVKAGRVEA